MARLLTLAILGWGTVAAGQATPPATTQRSEARVVATPLREMSRTAFTDGWFGWVNPARCDADGNILVLSIGAMDGRGLDSASSSGAPRMLLRVGADGKRKATIDLAGMPSLASAEGSATLAAVALGASGTAYALLWEPRGETSGMQYIVTLDENGRYRSGLEVDADEIAVQGLEVFGSGAFLLRGVRPWSGEPRLVIMPARGGILTDVVAMAEGEANGAGPLRLPDHLARGGDGRIYFVPPEHGGGHVHAVGPSGLSEHAFQLAETPRHWRLVGIKASGHRLAAIYQEEQAKAENVRLWVSVYDVRLGERLAVYGPLAGMPFCYQSAERRDELTVLKGGNLVRLSP